MRGLFGAAGCRRKETLFSFSEGRRWTATGVLTSRRGPDEGSLPEGPAANKEYSFILLHTSADKRSEGVSGALRGGQGRETGRGARALDSSLATRHLSLSSRPAAGSCERAGKRFVATASAFLTVGSSQDICTKTRFENMQSTDERVGEGQ